MNDTDDLILGAVDNDIAEHFKERGSGSYMTMLPLAIHISRHIAKISAIVGDKNSSNSPNKSGTGDDKV